MPGAELGECSSVAGRGRQRPPQARVVNADKHGWWWAVGRRKNAIARVRMKNADGRGTVRFQKARKKFKTVDEYFTETEDRTDVMAPLKVTGIEGKMDIIVRAGGGHTRQAQATRAIARALRDYDPNSRTCSVSTATSPWTTVASAQKYGQPGARKRFQFSKR